MTKFEIKNLMPRRHWLIKPDGTKTWRYFSCYKQPEHSHQVSLGSLGDYIPVVGAADKVKEYEQAVLNLLPIYCPDLVAYCKQHDIKLEAKHGYTWAGNFKIWFYASSTRQRLTKLINTIDHEQFTDRLCMISRTNTQSLRCTYRPEYKSLYHEIFPYSLEVAGSKRHEAAKTIKDIATAPWYSNDGWKIEDYRFHSDQDRMMAAMLLA